MTMHQRPALDGYLAFRIQDPQVGVLADLDRAFPIEAGEARRRAAQPLDQLIQ